jgi:hypothetical protein
LVTFNSLPQLGSRTSALGERMAQLEPQRRGEKSTSFFLRKMWYYKGAIDLPSLVRSPARTELLPLSPGRPIPALVVDVSVVNLKKGV